MLKVLSIILGLLMIIAGVCCFTLPGMTFLMLGYIIGIAMIIDGIERFIIWGTRDKGTDQGAWTLVSGILSLILGIVLIGNDLMQLAIDVFIIYMAIAWLIIMGIMRIAHAFRVRSEWKAAQNMGQESEVGRDWWIALTLGILMLILGIVGFFMPMAVVDTIGILIGIALVVSGINMIHFGTSNWAAA